MAISVQKITPRWSRVGVIAHQALIIGLFSVPQNFPLHYLPLESFYSEALAVAITATLLCVAALTRSSLTWKSSSWLFLALLAWTTLSQLFIDYHYTSQWLLPAVLFLCAVLISMVLDLFADGKDRFDILGTIAAGIVIGGTWQSVAGWFQLIEYAHLLQPWVGFSGYDGTVYGNIGHQNVFGHLMAWSSMATLWLGVCRVVDPRVRTGAYLLSAWFLLAGTWSVSRAFLLFLAYWCVLAGWMLFRNLKGESAGLARRLLVLAIIGIMFQFSAPVVRTQIGVAFATSGTVGTAIEQIDRGNFGARRLVEIKKAWRTFLDNPWTGVGFGGYAASSFRLQGKPEFRSTEESVLFIHTHNSPMQLIAEMGISGLLLVSGLGIYLLYLFHKLKTPEELFLWAVLGVVLIHSMVEFPLWYATFLLPMVAILSALETGHSFSNGPLHRIVLTVVSATILVSTLLVASYHYRIGDVWFPQGDAKTKKENYDWLASLRNTPVIDEWVDIALMNYFRRSQEYALLRWEVTERFAKYRPYYYVQTKYVCELGMQGNIVARNAEYEALVAAYPDRIQEFQVFFGRYGC